MGVALRYCKYSHVITFLFQHGAGEDFSLNEKASLDSKENGVQSPLSKRQKPGSDSPSSKTVCSVIPQSSDASDIYDL